MKNINYLVWMILIVGLSSCSDDFLERAPLANISDPDFWKSANDLKLYTNNFYNQDGLLPLRNGYGYGSHPYTIDAADGTDAFIALDYNRRMNGENTLPESGGGWSAGDWGLLRNINYFLDHYRLSDEPWDNIKQYAGEALFFKSIFYFNKVRTFGDVPWASTTVQLDSELLFAARLPRDQVVDSIMRDLDLAVEYLPARAGGGWTGRVTKETALALQARIALYEGTWEKYHALKNTPFNVAGSDGTKFIQKAADAADALIALAEANGFPALDNIGIENGYWKLFNQRDYSNHKEVMLWRKYSVAEGQYHRWLYVTPWGGSVGLTKNMIESYLCTDGKPIAVSPLYQGDQDLQTVTTNRDPRLDQTIYVDDGEHWQWEGRTLFTTPTFEGDNALKCVTGYQLYKGHDSSPAGYEERRGSGAGLCTAGQIYFRYGETLLIYAEAKAELGTITQSDIDKTVNALRQRAGMIGLLNMADIATDPNWEFSGISPLLQEIRRERKVELIGEGFRRDDIFRWAAADELMAGKRPLGAIKKQWENYPGTAEGFQQAVADIPVNSAGYIDPYQPFGILNGGYQFNLGRDYLSPIPANERVLNPNLTQNPGW
ncbi:RagB/SusD family nutrient uptake outer membrane protein [Parapedobacter sp. DT-150]|uniref:RagB/SusD family nutrient uptake outer membrane protein n=1 Tax=Parapedobacter sp. DT-150 TaxID=3396162 RepID=UPI003F1AEFF2